MIAHNEVNGQGELKNKADNCTVNNGACTIIPYPKVKVKHI